MTAIYLLIPISLIILIIAVRLFVWAVNNKQFNNLENISQSMLFEEAIQDRLEQKEKQKPSNDFNNNSQNPPYQVEHTSMNTESSQTHSETDKATHV
jgi:cbb3-type cytochrome oxidase maturation protein